MSSLRDRLRKKSAGLQKQHNASGEKKPGQRFETIFNKDKIPAGIDFYKVGEGQHLVDIIPFEVGSGMPLDSDGNEEFPEGSAAYVLNLWIHTNMGKNDAPHVCPYQNFGEPCPICEFIKANRLDKPIWSKLRAKQRSIYLVWGHNNREDEKKGIQILDSAFFFMEEKLIEVAKMPKGGGSVSFSDIDNGKSVAWTRKGTGAENTNYLGHKLVDRESPIPDKILEQTFPLDSIIKMHPSYEVIKKDFEDTLIKLGLIDKEEEEPPFKKSSRNRDEDEPQKENDDPGAGDEDVPTFDDGDDEPPTPTKKTSGVVRRRR
jgi:hypothetical protein